ncbi:MAG TPA: TIGR02611 family protein [Gryllotalpicola sp.]
MSTAERPQSPTDASPTDAPTTARAGTGRGAHRGARLRAWFSRVRAGLEHRPRLLFAYRALIGVLGVTVVVVGLILVPLPGPGWAIVFVGIALLGTEFAWAHRLLHWARGQLTRFWAWWRRVLRRKSPLASLVPDAERAEPAGETR